MSTNKRIQYYDVAKGILILLVILTHTFFYATGKTDAPNETIRLLRDYQWICTSFYMPAFFIVSGICSNFNKDFKPFLIKIFRTILVPAIFFDLFFFTVPNILFGVSSISEGAVGFVKRTFAFGGVYWFLPCLFLSKIIYWVLHNYTNDIVRWVVLMALFVFGFVLHHFHLYPQKWWYAIQTFDLTLFLGIGQLLKNTKIEKMVIYRAGTIAFLVIIVTFLVTKLPMPSVYYIYRINDWWQLPVHILASVSGTLFVLWISQRINSNSILEFLGCGTIVVYGVNELCLKIVANYMGFQIGVNGPIQSIILFVIFYIVIAALGMLAIRIFDTKYLKPVIGKS